MPVPVVAQETMEIMAKAVRIHVLRIFHRFISCEDADISCIKCCVNSPFRYSMPLFYLFLYVESPVIVYKIHRGFRHNG